MKRSELKEAIKAEITSVLSEAMSDEEREDKLQQAKRGGGKEKPLRKLAAIGKKSDEEELKEAMFNEDAVLEDVMLAIDLHLDGQIDYNEMSRRVEDLILGKEKSNFRVMNEGKMSQIVSLFQDMMDDEYDGQDYRKVLNMVLKAIDDDYKAAEREGEKFSRIREEDEPTDAEIKKADSVASAANKLQKLVKKMKDKAKDFKAAEGKAKEKIKDELKAMTAEKKKLEKSI